MARQHHQQTVAVPRSSSSRNNRPDSHAIVKVRLLASVVIGALIRVLLPVLFAARSASSWLLERRHLGLDALVAAISLSSLAEALARPCDPILRAINLVLSSANSTGSAEPCVSCNVLTFPTEEEHTCDVIFLHGLHGSLEKTWKQGDWPPSSAKMYPPRRVSSTAISTQVKYTGVAAFWKAMLSGHQRELKASKLWFCIDDMDSIEQNNIDYMEEESGEPLSQCWPRDWLPKDCQGCRVIALNYTTDPFLWRPIGLKKRNRSCLSDRSREMMNHLEKVGVGRKPIVWVGHSKGGLFIKQMLVHDEMQNDRLQFCSQTKGILWYSVPHRGSMCADINLPFLRKSVELIEVEQDSKQVLKLHDEFLHLINSGKLDTEIISFIETIQTFMSVLYLQIISMESADPGIGRIFGVPLDHRQICKPSNRECFLYQELIDMINRTIPETNPSE